MDKLIGYENSIKHNDILSIQINLLNRCTSKCVSCRKYTWPNEELPVDKIKYVLDFLKHRYRLDTVVLSGGDPILYNDFKELINYIYCIGLKCSIITTGITNNEDVIELLCGEKLYRIHLSLDAVDAYNYKYIRGVNGFSIVDKNIKIINDSRLSKGLIPIRLSSTISDLNYKFTEILYRYAKDRKCNINYYLVHTFEDLEMTDVKEDMFYRTLLKSVVDDENATGNVISNARNLLSDYIIGGKHTVNCNCYVPNISCVINANGDVYPCCRLMVDNGYYGEQRERAYGNILTCETDVDLLKVFEKRKTIRYPLGCEECKECGQRYYDMIQHLAKVKENRRDVLFI